MKITKDLVSVYLFQPNYEQMEEQRFRQQETRGKHKKGNKMCI